MGSIREEAKAIVYGSPILGAAALTTVRKRVDEMLNSGYVIDCRY